MHGSEDLVHPPGLGWYLLLLPMLGTWCPSGCARAQAVAHEMQEASRPPVCLLPPWEMKQMLGKLCVENVR